MNMSSDNLDHGTLAARIEALRGQIDRAHTPENLDHLRAECAKRGLKLTGSLKRKNGFSVVDPKGSKVSGVSLHDVERLIG